MNLADPELELIDPTPNIHNLFITFDKIFFWTKLTSRAVVRWSKRMYSCAGVCSYEGRGGLCDIALSEPLLKLRPRKNLVETLLHEMIHAYLFVTGNDRDRDGHGPNFQSHMHRINQVAGIEISIYHDFHDEVKLYQTHVWRCNGPCQTQRPFFGIVRRSMNRAPGPSDFWWNDHKRRCSGTFIKIKEPEKRQTKKAVPKSSVGDITKYINNNNSTMTNLNTVPKVIKTSPTHKVPIFDGKGHTVGKDKLVSVNNVQDTVRNAWLKKQSEILMRSVNTKAIEDNVTRKVKEMWANRDIMESSGNKNKNVSKTAIKKPSTTMITSPPVKVKKIDNYFSNQLKDSTGNTKDLETSVQKILNINYDTVNCPICTSKVKSKDINTHIDECLNKGEIERLHKTEDIFNKPSTSKSIDLINPSPFKNNITSEIIDLTNLQPVNVNNAVGSTKTIDVTNEYLKDFYNDCKLSKPEFKNPNIKVSEIIDLVNQVNNTFGEPKSLENIKKCPCCELNINKSMEDHLNECLAFFGNNATIPEEAAEPKSLETIQKCPCCELNINKSMEDHLDECLAFFDNNATIPEEGASTSYSSIDIDDVDDELDESMTMNATGTKTPCPVCLKMVEQDDMNNHLDLCLSS